MNYTLWESNYLRSERTLGGVRCGGYVAQCVVLEESILGRSFVPADIVAHAVDETFKRNTLSWVVYTLDCRRRLILGVHFCIKEKQD